MRPAITPIHPDSKTPPKVSDLAKCEARNSELTRLLFREIERREAAEQGLTK